MSIMISYLDFTLMPGGKRGADISLPGWLVEEVEKPDGTGISEARTESLGLIARARRSGAWTRDTATGSML